MWDVGGGDKIRLMYRHYYANASGLVWVLDSSDRERIDLVREEICKAV